MTEAEEVAQSLHDELKRLHTPRWKLPCSRDTWRVFVYTKMPDECYNTIDAVADALLSLFYAEGQQP